MTLSLSKKPSANITISDCFADFLVLVLFDSLRCSHWFSMCQGDIAPRLRLLMPRCCDTLRIITASAPGKGLMKAILLIGGEATRLRPLTCNRPKSMVPVLNTPFLEYVIRHLARHGVGELILTERQQSAQVKDYFVDGRQFGLKLTSVIETQPLGTAGAVKNTESYIDGPFLVLNGDVFTDLDVSKLVAFHKRRKAKATIALTPVEDPSTYGVVETAADGRVRRFIEKPPRDQVTSNMINAGTYVLEPEMLEYIPAGVKFSFERQLFPTLLERGEPVYAYPSDAYWIDIGTAERYMQLHMDMLGGRVEFDQPRIPRNKVIASKGSLKRGVKVVGPAVIGSGGTIGHGAVIERSILWERVRVASGARVADSIIANDCSLGERCMVEGSVLGDHVTVAAGASVKPGNRIWPGTVVAAE